MNATASAVVNGQTVNVTGTFTYTPAANTVLGAGNQTLQVSFTPDDSTDFTSATGSTTLTVNQATTTINWTTPSPIAYGTPLSSTQLNATAGAVVNGQTVNVAGTFTYTPAANTVSAPATKRSR